MRLEAGADYTPLENAPSGGLRKAARALNQRGPWYSFMFQAHETGPTMRAVTPRTRT